MRDGSKFRVIVAFVLCCAISSYAVGLVEQNLDYSDHLQELNNPARGPISHTGFMLAPGEKLDLSRGYVYADFMRLLVDLGAFSSNAWKPDESNNDVKVPRGTSRPLDEVSLNNMRAVLDSIRSRGGTCVIRTSYDIDCRGSQDPDLETTLGHIKQLANLYSDYEDIISFIELGMFGTCGEMTAGGQDAHAKALQTFLENSSDGVKVGVRSPSVVALWMGLKDPYSTWFIYPDFRISSPRFQDSAAARSEYMDRVGMYNDGYLGNDLDLGSYGDNDSNSLHRESSVAWLEKYGQVIPYGGDFVCNYNPETRPPLNTAEFLSYEGFRTHTSYLDGSMKGTCYNFMDTTIFRGIDAEYGGKVKGREYVRDHLGYRFVLRGSQITDSVGVGGDLHLKLKIQNVGFGNNIKVKKATLVLKPAGDSDGEAVEFPLSLDPSGLLSRKLKMKGLEYPHWSWTGDNFEDLYDPENPEFDGVTEVDETVKLPEDLPQGEWNAYLRFSHYGDMKTDKNFHVIQFANDSTYFDSATGGNFVGSFVVDEHVQAIGNKVRVVGVGVDGMKNRGRFAGRLVSNVRGDFASSAALNGSFHVGEIYDIHGKRMNGLNLRPGVYVVR